MEHFDAFSRTFSKSSERRDKMFHLCESLNDLLVELGGERISDDSFAAASRRMYEEARNKMVSHAWMMHTATNNLNRVKIDALKQDVGYDSSDDSGDSDDSDAESDDKAELDSRLHKAEAKEQMARRDYDTNLEAMKCVDCQLTDDYKVYLACVQANVKAKIDEKVGAFLTN